LIISADFEMAWAWRYTKTGADPLKKAARERKNLPSILKVFEEHNIPITFATVGHLFLQRCRPGDHEWMRRIPHFDDHWRFAAGDWFEHDPHTHYKAAPEWYAPDLVQMVLDSSVKHEIGCHTFSHIDFSYKNCPADVAADELTACRQAAQPYGIFLESFVFPGGMYGSFEQLKANGFQIYRKKNDFELAYPYRDEYGLLVSTSSGCLEYNLNYRWKSEYFISRLKKYVLKAMATHTIAHLWFHPSLDPFFIERIFPAFLSFAEAERQKGDLWIGPMNAIASYINQNQIL
jgi:peptidoglycan/xylan/chitin deacetylase (PgdA/CDA1 family)